MHLCSYSHNGHPVKHVKVLHLLIFIEEQEKSNYEALQLCPGRRNHRRWILLLSWSMGLPKICSILCCLAVLLLLKIKTGKLVRLCVPESSNWFCNCKLYCNQ